MIPIESRQNHTIRHLARLARDKKYRRAAGELVCEGDKMLAEALSSGVRVKTVLLRSSGSPDSRTLSLCRRAEEQGAALFSAEPPVFALASDVETPQGTIFSCESPVLSKALPSVRSAMLLDGVQDPGNSGTIIRTAEAFGLDALILCEGCADPTAPKVLRATMGAVFRQPLYHMPLISAVQQLREQGLPVYAAALGADSVPVTGLSLERCAVGVGSEGHGISRTLSELCDKRIIIPMTGRAESLNAGVAASLLIWEMRKAAAL